MNQMWFEDMMKQTFNEDICFNPTKLLILDFISYNNEIKSAYSLKELIEYVYEVYIDNPKIAEQHPSYMIRKIETYGVNDIRIVVEDALGAWIRDAINDILSFSDNYLYLKLDENDRDDIGKNTQRLCKMLYKKHFKGDIPRPRDLLTEIVGLDDKNIELFGKSIYRNRVLEDMQYCPICENTEIENLVVVHILNDSMGADETERTDKNNGLIFCKKHADAYNNREIEFNELGFVSKDEVDDVEFGMHLSFAIRNKNRKYYLKKRQELK